MQPFTKDSNSFRAVILSEVHSDTLPLRGYLLGVDSSYGLLLSTLPELAFDILAARHWRGQSSSSHIGQDMSWMWLAEPRAGHLYRLAPPSLPWQRLQHLRLLTRVTQARTRSLFTILSISLGLICGCCESHQVLLQIQSGARSGTLGEKKMATSAFPTCGAQRATGNRFW